MQKKIGLFLMAFTFLIAGCSKDPFVDSNSGTFKDSRDKHVYKWVRIGEQVWMSENLAYLPAISPSTEGSENETHYYVYDYEGSSVSEAKTKPNYTTYGVLYSSEAAKTACPAGWNLPGDEEWKILETYLGMIRSDADAEDFRESGTVGKKLKSTSGWHQNGNGDNSSGFNALPGGSRFPEGGFVNLSYFAYFWSSSTFGGWSWAWYRFLYNDNDGVGRHNWYSNAGFSVRCLKNPASAPVG